PPPCDSNPPLDGQAGSPGAATGAAACRSESRLDDQAGSPSTATRAAACRGESRAHVVAALEDQAGTAGTPRSAGSACLAIEEDWNWRSAFLWDRSAASKRRRVHETSAE